MMQLRRGKHNVLVVSDLQEPYAHRDALDFVVGVQREYSTDRTVFIGDEVDAPNLSTFPKDPDGKSAGDDLKLAIEALSGWYDAFPEAAVCTSNHTDRIFKLAFRAGIPKAYLKGFNEFLQAPKGWVWKDAFEIDGVRYEHGDVVGGQDAARQLAITNRQSTVIGHHHAHGGVRYVSNDTETIFGLNVGCLIDRHAYVFAYGKGNKFKPTLGCGVVLQGVPHFVPMLLNKKERWIGEVI